VNVCAVRTSSQSRSIEESVPLAAPTSPSASVVAGADTDADPDEDENSSSVPLGVTPSFIGSMLRVGLCSLVCVCVSGGRARVCRVGSARVRRDQLLHGVGTLSCDTLKQREVGSVNPIGNPAAIKVPTATFL
jgi:hypothetical protein